MPTPATPNTDNPKRKARKKFDGVEPQTVSLHSPKLARALQARQEYFNSLSPEMLENALAFQAEINDHLAKAGSMHNRMVVLSEMMRSNQLRLMCEIKELRSHCQDLCEKLKEL